MKRIEKIGLSTLAIHFLFNTIRLPTSPGNFYLPSHYYNLYLPNFGTGLDVSILNASFKTLLTQYSFLEVLLQILQEDIMTLHQSLHILSPILAFFAFVLFFSLVPDFKENRIVLSLFLSPVFTWEPIPFMLGMATLFCIIRSRLQANTYAFIISWILLFVTLTLYWHSAHLVFLFPIIFLLLTLYYIQLFKGKNWLPKNAPNINLNTFWIFLVISLFSWLFIQESPIFSNLFKITYFLDPSIIARGLLTKGSFIPLDYQYMFHFYIPVNIFEDIRYATYLLTFFVIIIYIIHTLIVKSYDLTWIWALSLLLGSLTLLFFYYIATNTITPAPILVFLVPFLSGLCMIKINIKIGSARIKLIYGILFILIMGSLALSESYNIYQDNTSSMEFNENFDKYYPSSMWVATTLSGKNVSSDANTIGYMAIWYGKNKKYDTCPVYFNSIGLFTYDQLYKGTYDRAADIIYNLDIYKKNLVFQSLEGWDKFKPLSPDIVQKNNFNLLYNDESIWILSK